MYWRKHTSTLKQWSEIWLHCFSFPSFFYAFAKKNVLVVNVFKLTSSEKDRINTYSISVLKKLQNYLKKRNGKRDKICKDCVFTCTCISHWYWPSPLSTGHSRANQDCTSNDIFLPSFDSCKKGKKANMEVNMLHVTTEPFWVMWRKYKSLKRLHRPLQLFNGAY